ncbi:hypothetical protein [Pseudomonas sp. v388]|nr:hypothetical protein [Pseudomonas sp. v388]
MSTLLQYVLYPLHIIYLKSAIGIERYRLQRLLNAHNDLTAQVKRAHPA